MRTITGEILPVEQGPSRSPSSKSWHSKEVWVWVNGVEPWVGIRGSRMVIVACILYNSSFKLSPVHVHSLADTVPEEVD